MYKAELEKPLSPCLLHLTPIQLAPLDLGFGTQATQNQQALPSEASSVAVHLRRPLQK